MLDNLRRILVVLALALWIGGLTFYAGVVVPVGSQILGAVEQGFVTQQVTSWLNLIAAAGCVILAWDTYQARTRSKLIALALLVLSQTVLFLLHPQLDALLEPARRVVNESETFYSWHRAYLWTTAVQWLAGVVYLCANTVSLRANTVRHRESP